jgi:hypothetical protein
MLYFSCRSQVSSPVDSFADKITTLYSPTSNCASMVTPRSRGEPPPFGGALSAAIMSIIGSGGYIIGMHGSCSQYSTRRGAASLSTRSNTSLGRIFTSFSDSTTGTGTTIAKSAAGPW